MNTLERMAGLDQMGYPDDTEYPDDPMQLAAYENDQDAMMALMGMESPMPNPYDMVGMEQPIGLEAGRMLSQEMLGGVPPQLGQDEINALAQALGLSSANGILVGEVEDPMYSPRFDVMNFMGGM